MANIFKRLKCENTEWECSDFSQKQRNREARQWALGKNWKFHYSVVDNNNRRRRRRCRCRNDVDVLMCCCCAVALLWIVHAANNDATPFSAARQWFCAKFKHKVNRSYGKCKSPNEMEPENEKERERETVVADREQQIRKTQMKLNRE